MWFSPCAMAKHEVCAVRRNTEGECSTRWRERRRATTRCEVTTTSRTAYAASTRQVRGALRGRNERGRARYRRGRGVSRFIRGERGRPYPRADVGQDRES